MKRDANMKKVRNFMAAMAAAAILPAFGAEMTSDNAIEAVNGWLRLRESLGESVTGTPESVKEYSGSDGKGKYYVVSLAGGGYVVASGDDGVARLSAEDFDRAYLCNLDVTKDGASATFKITGITVGDDSVDVTVSLVRTNPLLAQDGETPAPINGVLRFYGAATLEAFTSGAASKTSVLSEERFGGGATEATETFQKVNGNVTNSFFNVKIEEH